MWWQTLHWKNSITNHLKRPFTWLRLKYINCSAWSRLVQGASQQLFSWPLLFVPKGSCTSVCILIEHIKIYVASWITNRIMPGVLISVYILWCIWKSRYSNSCAYVSGWIYICLHWIFLLLSVWKTQEKNVRGHGKCVPERSGIPPNKM